jgi:hypothetical protein
MRRFVAGEDRKPGDSLVFERVVLGARDSAHSPRTNKLNWAPRRTLADAPIGGADDEGAGGFRIPIAARLRLKLGDA